MTPFYFFTLFLCLFICHLLCLFPSEASLFPSLLPSFLSFLLPSFFSSFLFSFLSSVFPHHPLSYSLYTHSRLGAALSPGDSMVNPNKKSIAKMQNWTSWGRPCSHTSSPNDNVFYNCSTVIETRISTLSWYILSLSLSHWLLSFERCEAKKFRKDSCQTTAFRPKYIKNFWWIPILCSFPWFFNPS